MNLFKVLVLSWLIGVGLTFFKDVSVAYEIKCASMSLIYLLAAFFCYRYAEDELLSGKILQFYLISALCSCMIISCWFNFIFINKDIYSALVDIRYYNAFSWKNTYKSVELLALFIVGKNAIIRLSHWFICRSMRVNATITDNKHNKSGRQT